MAEYDIVLPCGLLRCCIETIEGLYPGGPGRYATEGQRMRCKYAPDNPLHEMIFHNGAWEWDRKRETAK